MEKTRSSFSGKLGFILAAAGSAVGLGNIWRFPYLAAKYGGGTFLLIYIILSVTFGFALMVAEICIGRKTGLSPIGAFGKLNKKFSFLGYLAALIPVMILPYYSVIGGWVTKYFFSYATNNIPTNSAAVTDKSSIFSDFFNNFVCDTGSPILWFLIFIGVTALIVWFGVEKGIEKVSKIMMPVLVFLSIGIAIYVLFQDGALEGAKYYLIPDFSNMTPQTLLMTVVAAMGQLFYSMSLAMGIMITYGSYMKKDVNVESAVHKIEWFDTGIAFFAGLMVIPAIFAAGGSGIEKPGPGLMFVALPSVFDSMPGGKIIGTVFFLLVFLAALTSSISLMETVVSIFQDKFKMRRGTSCAIVLGICVLLGLPSSLGFGIWDITSYIGMTFLDLFDLLSNYILMPIAALLTCILVGYIIKPKAIIDEVELSGKFKHKKLFVVMIKYIAPVFLLIILVSSVLDTFSDSFTI